MSVIGSKKQMQLQPHIGAAAAPVFRFNLSEEMVDALLQFSKTHQHDDRETYKEAWTIWKRSATITALFENESERLKMSGYRGSAESVEDKIFKSGRYYFRNKSFLKAPPTKRCKYIPMSKELISAMDSHITRMKCEGVTTVVNVNMPFSPASLFINFCQTHTDVLNDEINRLVNLIPMEEGGVRGGKDELSIISKIKKTYKNRVFKMNSQNNSNNSTININRNNLDI